MAERESSPDHADDGPFLGTPGEPIEEEMGTYLTAWSSLPRIEHPRVVAVDRLTERYSPLGFMRLSIDPRRMEAMISDELPAVLAEDAAIVAENARRVAEPEWPIDWRSFRG